MTSARRFSCFSFIDQQNYRSRPNINKRLRQIASCVQSKRKSSERTSSGTVPWVEICRRWNSTQFYWVFAFELDFSLKPLQNPVAIRCFQIVDRIERTRLAQDRATVAI